jgi:hypothetical protein
VGSYKPDLFPQSALAALDFFTTVFMWYEPLSWVTTGLVPSCPDWLSALLDENDRIQVCKIMGCKNWAVSIITDIAALEHWKKQCQYSGNISLQELARRASGTEKRLNDGLATNSKILSSYETGRYGRLDLQVRAVINVYGCLALTYLHTVLSDAYPELPKIREVFRGPSMPSMLFVRGSGFAA